MEGRFWIYELRDGMRAPLEGEVAWAKKEDPMMQWFHRSGHPNWMARYMARLLLINHCSAVVHALGVEPKYLVTLEVAV